MSIFQIYIYISHHRFNFAKRAKTGPTLPRDKRETDSANGKNVSLSYPNRYGLMEVACLIAEVMNMLDPATCGFV